MNKRDFLKTSSLLITGSILSPLAACNPESMTRRNWAGNYAYSTNNLQEPKNLDEVRNQVKKLSKLRVLGSRHSFNGIADSTENQISSRLLDQLISLDESTGTVTVEGGMSYGQLCPLLSNNGHALHNLASLPHISIAGACATATHGSGDKNGNLATAVTALEFVTADGDIVYLSRNKDKDFAGAVVALGGLGLVTKISLEIQPAFMMEQYVYRNLPLKNLQQNFENIMSSAYSVSLFTDWKNPYINQVWIKKKITKEATLPAEEEFWGAKLAEKDLHPIEEISAVNCTEQMGVPGPWHERLPHFRMNFTPSSGKELQSEFFVPRQHAVEAIMAISSLGSQISPHLMISEIRSIAADQLWMSPCYHQDCIAIHFTWKQDWPAVSQLLPVIEKQLDPFQVRPHWGKLFTISPEKLSRRYEKLPDFQKLLQAYDPRGKFRNEFLELNIFGATG